MPLNIIETPICYVTFQTEDEIAPNKLRRCSRCRCAWYASKDDQLAHWGVHKTVCKPPDYKAICKYTAAQCIDSLSQAHIKMDHNTAAILERLYDLIREANDNDTYDDLDEPDLYLHSLTRLSSPGMSNCDYLEGYYKRAWACPGMPQFLHFTDLRSSVFRQLSGKSCGLPESVVSDSLDIRTNGDGADIAWFVVGFLIRSCVYGNLKPHSCYDGVGKLRDTNYATAARKRIVQIVSSNILRHCGGIAFCPVPSFIINIGQNNTEQFIEMLSAGVGPFLLEWVHYDPETTGYVGVDFLSRVDLSWVADDAKLDILEICLNIFTMQYDAIPTDTDLDCGVRADIGRVRKGYVKVAQNVMTCSPDIISDLLKYGLTRQATQYDLLTKKEKRMILGFIHKKIAQDGAKKVTMHLKKHLLEWENMDYTDRKSYLSVSDQ